MKIELVELTKPQAREILDGNIKNRAVSQASVKKYTYHMNAGTWDWNNGDSIRIDKNEKLIDGQHRLLAFLNSDLDSCRFLMIKDLEVSAMESIDIGSKRHSKDFFKMEGVQYSHILAYCIANILSTKRIQFKVMLRSNNSAITNTIPVHQLLEEYYRRKEDYDFWASEASKYSVKLSKKNIKGTSSTLLFLIMWKMDDCGWNKDIIFEYFKSLIYPDEGSVSDMVSTALARFTKEDSGRIRQAMQAYAIIYGFNNYMENSNISRITIPYEKGSDSLVIIPNVVDKPLFNN